MSSPREWKGGKAKEITFVVTKDCQLGCHYCYQVGKNSHERMSWETAKEAVDYILDQEKDDTFNYESVVFAFIGGEPFLEIDLIDQICDYIKIQLYLRNHHWFNSYRLSITTNGINYDSQKVQRFIKKNKKHISITITIDGTKRKHNMHRVWKRLGNEEEHGSYDDVIKNIPLWLSQFPDAATKVTVSSDDLPYVCESVLHIYDLGIKNIYINCVYENVWKYGDDVLLEVQLKKLADEIISRDLYDTHFCSFFDPTIGRPYDASFNWNWCGTGRTLSIDASGNLYPCTRFAKFSLREQKPIVIGNVRSGIKRNLLRPFEWLRRDVQSTKECFECEVASGCAWCQAENYDSADTPTIFQRSTSICKMHKARVRANNYYWSKVYERSGKKAESLPHVENTCKLDKTIDKPERIIVLLAEDSASYCHLSHGEHNGRLIRLEHLKLVISKAQTEDIDLCFVYPKQDLPSEYQSILNSVNHRSIAPIDANIRSDIIVLNGWEEINKATIIGAGYVLRTTLSDFYSKTESLYALLSIASMLKFVFVDEEDFKERDFHKYENALIKLKDMVLKEWLNGRQIKINLVTDRLFLNEMNNCDAGWKTVTLAPNASYYICPSFYYHDPLDSCGNIDEGLNIKNPLLYKLNHAPLCSTCHAYQCSRCIYLNKKKTLEVNIPSYEQCERARIELNVTKQFFLEWNAKKNRNTPDGE